MKVQRCWKNTDLHISNAHCTNSSSIERYNVTGISKFAEEMKEKGLGQPKVSLQFELSNSGITRLVKAEVACEEIVIVQEEVEIEDEEEAKKEEEATTADSKDGEEKKDEEKKEEEAKTDETLEEVEEVKANETKEEAKPEEKKKKTKLVDKVRSQKGILRYLRMSLHLPPI